MRKHCLSRSFYLAPLKHLTLSSLVLEDVIRIQNYLVALWMQSVTDTWEEHKVLCEFSCDSVNVAKIIHHEAPASAICETGDWLFCMLCSYCMTDISLILFYFLKLSLCLFIDAGLEVKVKDPPKGMIPPGTQLIKPKAEPQPNKVWRTK